MTAKRFTSFCILFFLCYTTVWAQPKPVADSIIIRNTDSSQQVAEAYLVSQREQQQIDSVIAKQLRNELEQSAVSSRQRKVLEDSLRQLSKREAQRKNEQVKRISELKQNAVPYPVILLTDTLFDIYMRIGSFSAAERARAISERINNLYEDAFFDADSLSVVQGESTFDIVYKQNTIIMSVTELDALWFGRPTDKIAQEYLRKISKAIGFERKDNSFTNQLLRIGYIILIIAGIWLIIWGVNRLFRRIAKNAES